MSGLSRLQAAKRAFVRVLLQLASLYGIAPDVNRESPDDALIKALRVRTVCRSAKARRIAKNLAGGLKKVCKEVLDKEGAATRG